MESYSESLTREQLRDRLWYRETVRRLFPSPTRVIRTTGGQRVDLYWRPNVLRIEESAEFARIQAEAAQATEVRRREAIRAAREDVVALGKLTRPQLREAARIYQCEINHKSPHRAPLVAPAMIASTQWDRIELDYLIHHANWRVEFDHFKRNPVRKAEEIRTERLLFSTARQYPHLKSVCRERLMTVLTGNPRRNDVIAILDSNAPLDASDLS